MTVALRLHIICADPTCDAAMLHLEPARRPRCGCQRGIHGQSADAFAARPIAEVEPVRRGHNTIGQGLANRHSFNRADVAAAALWPPRAELVGRRTVSRMRRIDGRAADFAAEDKLSRPSIVRIAGRHDKLDHNCRR